MEPHFKISEKDFAIMMRSLKATVQKFAPPLETANDIRVWYEAFKDFDVGAMRKAYVFCRDNCEQFPILSELLGVVKHFSPGHDEQKNLLPKPLPKDDEINLMIESLSKQFALPESK